jgi:hypothetical protein
MLDEREPAAGFKTANHQPSADAAEASRLAVSRTNDADCRDSHGTWLLWLNSVFIYCVPMLDYR